MILLRNKSIFVLHEQYCLLLGGIFLCNMQCGLRCITSNSMHAVQNMRENNLFSYLLVSMNGVDSLENREKRNRNSRNKGAGRSCLYDLKR